MSGQPTLASVRIDLGPMEEFGEGERRIVSHGRISIGVFRVNHQFHAVRNFCPHEGAELCRGPLTGTNLPAERAGEMEWGAEGYVLRCPWHAWEFDIRNGQSFTGTKMRVKTYPVEVVDGRVQLFPEGKPCA